MLHPCIAAHQSGQMILIQTLVLAGHVWYNFLDAMVMPKHPKSNKAVVLKMLADQVLWAPFFSCVFFTFIYALQVSSLGLLWLTSSSVASTC